MLRLIKFVKDFLLFIPLTFIINPFYKFYLFLSQFNTMIVWIRKHKKEFEFCDFYTPVRNYEKRHQLYEFVINRHIGTEPIHYLEFGVAHGGSFKWWLKAITNASSRFFGFDTFEGLPENWSFHFKKGDMASNTPVVEDDRAAFFKGIFQDSLNPFLREHEALMQSKIRKVIHMDADLYSSTLFTLSQLYPYLQKGDIILFDEFNVANHEFKAFKEFTESFYVRLKPVATVNNFYQAAFIVD